MSARPALEIVDPGLESTVQAWPGRQGLTSQGYFPSGPMDHLSFRAANILVGNSAGAPALEVPKIGLSVVFLVDTQIAIAAPGATGVLLNESPMSAWETIGVRAGDVLRTIGASGPGFRLYLAVRGGLAVPDVYGSAATSLVAGIGGLEGRALVRGDILSIWTERRSRAVACSSRCVPGTSPIGKSRSSKDRTQVLTTSPMVIGQN